MNIGYFGKPFVLPTGPYGGPYLIGPGFATYPAAGATLAAGYTKVIPVPTFAAAPFYGKPFFYGI